jgi:signal transduction histidine kinase
MARTNVDELLAAFSDLVATSIGQADAQAELAASRARIVATADETRRRIERDLHDGIQQRLVTLGLTLRVLRDSVPSDSPDLRDRLVRVEQGLGEAVDELREIARGVHPAILSQGGLGPALRSVARRAAVPVQVSVAGDLPDLAEPIEIAAYYVVSEALTNAAKHAAASRVVVDARVVDECLRVEVSDDGCGGATRTAGSGLIGLSDRVDALGGALSLDSPPGRGTRITATLPLTLPADVRSDRRLAGQAG